MTAQRSSTRLRQLLPLLLVVLSVSQLTSVATVMRRTRPVSVEQAVDRFRQAARAPDAATDVVHPLASSAAPTGANVAAGGTPAPMGGLGSAPGDSGARAGAAAADQLVRPAVPPSGVYVYATAGFEEIGLPGGRRGYPAQTTMTVRPTGCGADVRWDVFDERWALWETCSPTRGIELRAFTTHHEFFRQVEHRRYECTPGSELRPAADAPGSATRGRCDDGHATVDVMTAVIAAVTIEVAGTAVDAIHVRIDEVLAGNTTGTRSSDSWYRSSDGLLLRRKAVTDVESETVVGNTSYREEVTLDLVSLEPRR